MLKVLADLKLPKLTSAPYVKQCYRLPQSNCTLTRTPMEVCMKRCILNLVTIPNLRAAYVFRFNKTHTHWTVFEPPNAPLTQKEVRGALFFTTNEMKRDRGAVFRKIKEKPKVYIRNTKPIIKEIENLSKLQKVFIILVFKNLLFMTGNFYDESAICHALINFTPRKNQMNPELLKPDLLESRKVSVSNLLQPRTIKIKEMERYEHLV
jgi:hypothetical protein